MCICSGDLEAFKCLLYTCNVFWSYAHCVISAIPVASHIHDISVLCIPSTDHVDDNSKPDSFMHACYISKSVTNLTFIDSSWHFVVGKTPKIYCKLCTLSRNNIKHPSLFLPPSKFLVGMLNLEILEACWLSTHKVHAKLQQCLSCTSFYFI